MRLVETNFIPILSGIALGILAGQVPISLSGVPVPVRLGITGGPLLLAILLSRMGRIGPLVRYMPASANTAFRELGSVLFLSCVGLKAGEKFVEMAFSSSGLTWLWVGFCISVIPILLVGLTARLAFKLNFTTISGLLAGSMTDTPALAFATGFCKSDAPSDAYATVYPLTLILRVVSVQVLVLMLCRWRGVRDRHTTALGEGKPSAACGQGGSASWSFMPASLQSAPPESPAPSAAR